ncbi:hypothetical protein C1645_760191 [Glomus cerebriforme]|uniref:Galactose oxidase n=1 Tax=Glomus cerebriforme TaxID=658196 RepID=A0A397T851_9GLOM|nr:hypothetical protein C1645_760191 [Glomus cerebriforme]
MYDVFVKKFLIILFSLSILVKSAPDDGRFAHSSAVINNQFYIMGGQVNSPQIVSNDVFYLDLSQSFNLQNPSWIDITKSSGMPFANSWASSAVSGDGILMFGGYTWSLNSRTPDNSENTLCLFNTTTKQWSIPAVNGKPPTRRKDMKIISDNTNNFYIYSGIQLNDDTQWFLDMYMLDFSGLNWELTQMNNAPTFPRADYTATMLPSGIIVYIGGRTSVVQDGLLLESELNITQLTLFDTKDATWYPMVTNGVMIDNRRSHSAVLTSDGRIIIYGGVKGNNSLAAMPQLAVLDTTTTSYTWSVPIISTQTVPLLAFHTADLYGDYMIVAFGNVTNGVTPPTQMSSNIYMLDTKNYSWITSYSSNLNISMHHDHNSIGLIMGLICAGVVIIVIFGVLGALLYKRYKGQGKETVIATPGSSLFENAEEGGNVRDSYVSASARLSNITDNNRNSANTESSMISQSRPTSTTYDNNLSPPPPYVSLNISRPSSPYTTQTSYTGIGGIGPKNPPYGSRN